MHPPFNRASGLPRRWVREEEEPGSAQHGSACLLTMRSLGKEGLLSTKEKKTQQLADLTEKLSRSKAVILADYKGLTVAEVSELRRVLKDVGAEFKVAKNTLCSLAVKGTPVDAAQDFFTGPTGIAFVYDDPVTAAKRFLEFAQKNDKLKIKSGVFEGKLCSTDDLKVISSLPPREVLLSILAGALQAPLSKLAASLNATITQFAYALEALKTRKSQ